MAPARVLRVAVTEEFEKITELGVREVRCRHAPQVGPIHLTGKAGMPERAMITRY